MWKYVTAKRLLAARAMTTGVEVIRPLLAAGDTTLRAPALPRIPARMGLNDYMILPSPRTDEETGEPLINKKTGKQVVEYMVVQKPHVAHQKGIYITGKEVANASPNYVRKGYVDVVLNRAGAASMGKLTGGMQIGSDRLAVVLNNQITMPAANKKQRNSTISAPVRNFTRARRSSIWFSGDQNRRRRTAFFLVTGALVR